MSTETKVVLVPLKPDCIHGENIGEFYPEAIGMATAALEQLLTPDSRDHRDAGILAACAVSTALQALVAVNSGGPFSPETTK